MFELSTDELTILDLAMRGQSMMPIGRWQQPVAHLVELGYLHAIDKFNTMITDAGKTAHAQQFDKVDTGVAIALINQHNAAVHYREKANRLAQELAGLVKEASEATGDKPALALQKIVSELRNAVLGLLDE